MERMKWIDGLKGIACVGIFYHHFFLRYAPESYYGQSAGNLKFFIYLSESPLGFLINGNFWVYMFLLISGYVVCRRVVNTSYGEIPIFTISRYLKLAIPIFISETFYYVFYKLKIGGGAQLFTEADNINSFLIVPKNAFIQVLFFGDTTFAGAFWMMNLVFLGGLLVIALSSLGKNYRNCLMWAFLIFTVILLLRQSYYYSVILFGAFLYCFLDTVKISFPAALQVLGLVFGILLGGYPTGVVPEKGIYSYITFSFISENAAVWHWLGSVLIFVSLFHCRYIKNFLETKTIQWVGGISYIFFVFHNFMRKIFDPLYFAVLELFDSQILAIVIGSTVVITALFAFCEIYARTFGVCVSKAIKRFLNYVRIFNARIVRILR